MSTVFHGNLSGIQAHTLPSFTPRAIITEMSKYFKYGNLILDDAGYIHPSHHTKPLPLVILSSAGSAARHCLLFRSPPSVFLGKVDPTKLRSWRPRQRGSTTNVRMHVREVCDAGLMQDTTNYYSRTPTNPHGLAQNPLSPGPSSYTNTTSFSRALPCDGREVAELRGCVCVCTTYYIRTTYCWGERCAG